MPDYLLGKAYLIALMPRCTRPALLLNDSARSGESENINWNSTGEVWLFFSFFLGVANKIIIYLFFINGSPFLPSRID